MIGRSKRKNFEVQMPAKLYDWDARFTRRGFVLWKGRDYNCSQSSICQQIRNAASQRGWEIEISDEGNRVEVTVKNWDKALLA